MIFKNSRHLILTSPNKLILNHFNYQLIFLLKKNNLINLSFSKFTLPLKVKKFTFLKSPHIYKTARTQLELRTTKQSLVLTNFTQIQSDHLKQMLRFFTANLNVALNLKIKQKTLIFI